MNYYPGNYTTPNSIEVTSSGSYYAIFTPYGFNSSDIIWYLATTSTSSSTTVATEEATGGNRLLGGGGASGPMGMNEAARTGTMRTSLVKFTTTKQL